MGERIFIHNDLFCIIYIWKEMQITCVASGKSNYVFGDQVWRKTFVVCSLVMYKYCTF